MSTLPAFMQNYTSRNLAETLRASVGSASPPSVSIEGGQFSLHWPDGESVRAGGHDPQVGLFLDVVIIDANAKKSKTYFGREPSGALKKYDSANPAPPVCFSDNGIGPSTMAGEPQAPTCASCPQNVMGSALSLKNKPAQACRDSIKSAVVVPAYPDDVFLLRIPPNSFKHLRTLTDQCAKGKVSLEQVITRIYFEQGVVGTLMFKAISFVQDEALFKNITQALADKATDTLVGRTDQPREGLSLPPAQAVAALPAPESFQPNPLPVQAAAAPTTAPTPPATTSFALPSTASPQQATPTLFQGGTAAVASPSEPPKRRRRTAEQIAADNAAAAPQAGAPVAPFRQAPATPTESVPMAPSGPAATFGMVTGVAPDPAMKAAIDNIFGT